MKNQYILQTELQKLASNTMSKISPHSLGQWLKVQTNKEYIVIPRVFAVALIDNVKITSVAKSSLTIKERWGLEEIEVWL